MQLLTFVPLFRTNTIGEAKSEMAQKMLEEKKLKQKLKQEMLEEYEPWSCITSPRLMHSLQDESTIEQIIGPTVLARVKEFLRTRDNIDEALNKWNEFEKCIKTDTGMDQALINRFNVGLEKRIVHLELDFIRKDTLYKQSEAALREALSAGPGPGEGAKPAVAANVAVPQKEGVFLTGGRRHNLARKVVKRKKTGKDLKRKKQKICDLGPESRAPDSCDITKRKKDNLAERKQGDKAKVRSKVNNGAGKRRLGTPDSYDEKRARQNRESVKKCKLKLKLEAEKVKEKVAELRKEKENLEVIFSCGKESGHNTNCLQEDTSCTLTTIEAPHDVPADQNTEIEIGKQYSKRELKNMREKNRYHKEKANRRENQIELKKLQEDIHRLYAYINANHPIGPQNEEWQQATTSHQVSPSIPKLACSGRN